MTDRRTIPDSGDAITAGWMQQALAAEGASDIPPIEAVDVEPIGTGLGLLSNILRCRLTYRDSGGQASPAAGAAVRPRGPGTVIVKLPGLEPESRRLSKRFALYKREYDYYRRFAPLVPLRTPRLFYADYAPRSDRFVLVLEDLRAMESADQIAGASAEQAIRAIRAIARLHGHFWNRVDEPDLSGCRRELSPRYRPLIQIVYLANLAPTLRHFGATFSKETRRLVEAYGPRAADHLGVLAGGPMTFCHGDFRLDNMFFGDNDDFAVIDWQISGIQSCLYDVAYFLATSVSSDVRRRVEREALGQYHEIVLDMGVTDFTFEDCWHLYRHSILGRLVTAVITCGGLRLDDERSYRLADISLRRTLTAIEDLGAGELIPPRRRTLTPAGIFSSLSRVGYALLKAAYRP